MTKIAILLDDDVVHGLAQLAREAQLSEEALVRETIERLVRSQHPPAVPRFARRLGPLSIQRAER
jgi:predicted transcriptional regulator